MCKRNKLLIGAAVLLLAVLVIVGIGLRSDYQMDQQQEEILEELERDAGKYDPQSIVLQATSKAKAEKLASLFDAQLRISSDGHFATLTLPEDRTIIDVFSMKESRKYLSQMQADYYIYMEDLEEVEEPTGERQPVAPKNSWNDTDYDKQTYLNYLNLDNVWSKYSGKNVTVAVIDTGIDTDHPEFAGKISEYSYNVIKDKIVKDFVGEDGQYDWSLIEDEQGHGTAVAGVIASARDGEGIVGIAPNVNLIVIKASEGKNKQFSSSAAVFGIYYAIEQGADVVNMSFGGNTNVFDEVLQLAYDSDVICVASAGNSSLAGKHYPSSDPRVIGVGALEENSWQLASYSNYGESLDLVAPGTTYTAQIGGGYVSKDGTSLAAPIVTALLALYLQDTKYETFDKLTEVLYASCYDLGDPGNDWIYGYGAIDANALIQEDRGSVTFDMLTDELENTKGLFIRGHAMQTLPEPERLYAVFDGWYYDDALTERVEYYHDIFYEDLTLYAKWVNEDDGVPFTYAILDDGTVEIRSYTGHRRYITIPDTIEDRTVTSIGPNAFQGEKNLREVVLPSGLKYIKDHAFDGCSNLISMQIPAGVVSIGIEAFKDNLRLVDLTFAEQSVLKTISNFAFKNCCSLERLELPATLSSVSGLSFYGATALHTIDVRLGGLSYASRGGVLYTASGSTLVAYPAAHGITYALPDATETIAPYAFATSNLATIDLNCVKLIDDHAFESSKLTSVTMPDTVLKIGIYSFAGCEYLQQVRLSENLRNIPEYAFSGCSLQTIEIPKNVMTIGDSAFLSSGVTEIIFAPDCTLVTIGKSAFSKCALTRLYIPDSVVSIQSGTFSGNCWLEEVIFGENSQLTTIEGRAFTGCGFETFTIPKTVLGIGPMAFASTKLTEITIPASVSNLGAGAFASCMHLQAVDVEEGNKSYHSIDGVLYSMDNKIIHTYPAGKTDAVYTIHQDTRTIMSYAFHSTVHLTKVIVPEGMEAIGDSAFLSCGASEYTLPSTLKIIGIQAFAYNSNLKSIQLPNGLQEIGVEAFESCNLRMLTIPDSVTHIGRYAFTECWNLTTISFGANSKLTRLGMFAFANTGVVYFTVPANVSTMAQYVFEGCKSLRTVTFAEGSKLTYLPAYAFSGCRSLYAITFKQGSSLTRLQAHSLEGISGLSSLDLTNTKLTEIGNFAFRFCDNLTSLALPDTVVSVGRYAFYCCTSMSELKLPEMLEHIGSFAFLGTNKMELYLASETMPAYLDEDWDYGLRAYYNGVSAVATEGDYRYAILTSGNIAILEYLGAATEIDLNELDLEGDITIIGGSAFEESAVKSVVLPETLCAIQAKAFAYSALESITIPAGVSFIGREAFTYTPIESLAFEAESMLSTVEPYAFAGTQALKTVALPSGLQSLGKGAFMDSGLTSVYFPEDIELSEIPERCFAGSRLTEVTLPDSVTLVNHHAFSNLGTLKMLTFGENDGIRLMSNAFYHTGLTQLCIPENVTYIGEFCFVALEKLEAFEVAENNPNYVAVDGILMSKDQTKLICVPGGKTGSYTVPETVEVIGFGAFETSSLSQILFHPDANILTLGYRAFFQADGITSITIPASVVSVDYYAFGYCDQLETVIFEENCELKGIYEGAFIGCSKLWDIMLPDYIVEISDFAFYGCSALTKLPISKENVLKGIYDYAFAYSGLSGELVLPDTLNDIGARAFMGSKLHRVLVPDSNASILIIGIGAFESCEQLEEITLPFIGAEYECKKNSWFGYIFGAGNLNANDSYIPASLKTVTITEGITFVGSSCFKNITTIDTLYLPESVSIIGSSAFENTTFRYELKSPVTTQSTKNNVTISYLAKAGHFGAGLSGTVTLSEDVTQMEQAFKGCQYLKKVVLSSGITTIGSSSFAQCTSLEEIVISENVTEIGSYAFSGCSMLQTVDIPAGVTKIHNYAFENCTQVYSVSLPDTLQTLGTGAFSGCTGLTKITIPESITTIPNYLFKNCSNLSYVEILGDVTDIGAEAFYYCDQLTSIDISESLKSIGNRAFSYCQKLTRIDLPEQMTSLGSFEYCTGLTEFRVPEGVTSLVSRTFLGCSNLQTVHIPYTVTNIGDNAFQNCTNLRQVTGGENVVTIGNSAFYDCTNLESFYLSDQLTSIGTQGFYRCAKLNTIVLPETLTSLGGSAFAGCKALTKVHIPAGLTAIPSNAFSTAGIQELTFDEGVQTIGSSAFGSCPLVTVEFPNSLVTIGNSAFRSCPLVTIELPDSVTTVGNYAFEHCTELQTLRLGSGVTSFSTNALNYCTPSEIIVDEANTAYFCSGSHLYDLTTNKSIFAITKYKGEVVIPSFVTQITGSMFSGFSRITKIVLHDGVTSIGASAFANCTSLQEMVIPDSVKSISWNALSGCTALESLVIGDGVTTAITDGLFSKCTELHTVVVGDGISSIGTAFKGCANLQQITLGKNVKSLVDNAFKGCANLQRIDAEAVTSVGAYCFSDCGKLTDLNLKQKLTAMGNYAFQHCVSLKQLPDLTALTSIPSYAFYDCLGITQIQIPDNITSIGAYAFLVCKNVESIVIGDGVTTINNNAFEGCNNVMSVTLGEKVSTIGQYAFNSCYRLYEVINKSKLAITLGNSGNGYVGYFAYVLVDAQGNASYRGKNTEFTYIVTDDGFRFLKRADNDYLLIAYLGDQQNITLPATIQGSTYTIHCFRGGMNVTIPAGITIGENAFFDNKTITSVTICDGNRAIGNYAFQSCTSLKEITLGEGVTTLGTQAFYGCVALESIVLPDSVTWIQDRVFSECSSLETITFGIGVKRIGVHNSSDYAFQECARLKAIIVPEDNPNFASLDGVLYNKQTLTMVFVPAAVSGEIRILDGLTTIMSNAFSGRDITAVIMPNSVTTIGGYAFSECSALKDITWSNALVSIDGWAFKGCNSLVAIELPNSVTSTGSGVFSYCEGLREVKLSSGLKVISNSVFGNCKNLQEVIIPEGAIEISRNAFTQCTSLSSIEIPDSVETIGYHAFYACSALQKIQLGKGVINVDSEAFVSCTGLTEVILNEGLVSLGDYAFSKCTALAKVTMHEGLESIGASAFKSCGALKEIRIPDSVTYIGSKAFPSDTNVIFSENNQQFLMQDGILYDMVGMSIVYVSDELPSHVAIPEGITTLPSSIFAYRKEIVSVVLPDSLITIESYAFQGCEALENVEFGNSLEVIASYAFSECKKLKSAILPDTMKTIGSHAFLYCSSLTEMELGNQLESIGGFAFSGCQMSDLDLPETLKSIGGNAFRNCSRLGEITLPSQITEIVGGLFDGCYSLKTVNCEASITSIGGYAFSSCISLEHFVIPDDVTTIGSYVFDGCSSLKTLTIGRGVTSFDLSTFNATSLEAFIVSEDNTAFTSVNGVLYNKDQTQLLHVPRGYRGHIVLPEYITTLEYSFVGNCKNITSITIHAGVVEITQNAFNGCTSLEKIYVAEENPYYFAVDGILYPASRDQFWIIPAQISGDITIPEGMRTIPASTFAGKVGITSVSLPDGLQYIYKNAFNGCTGLRSVAFNDDLLSIGESAFDGCNSLATLAFPDSLTSVEKNAFRNCKGIQLLSIGSAAIQYGESAFSNAAIQVLDLGDLAAWCSSTFYNVAANPLANTVCFCMDGEEVWNLVIPEGVTSIPSYAFYYAKILQVTLPSTLTSIGASAFEGCSRVYFVINNSGVDVKQGYSTNGSVARYAKVVQNQDGSKSSDNGYTDFAWIVTDDGLCFAWDGSGYTLHFYRGKDQMLVLPDSFRGTKYAIKNLNGATHVVVPGNITSWTFQGNTGLKSVVLQEGITTIDTSAFSFCYGLEQVTLPSTLTYVGQWAFNSCYALQSIEIPEGVTSIGQFAFQDCSALTEMSLPDSLRRINQGVFNASGLYVEDAYGVVKVDGWIIAVDEDVEYIDLRGVRGASMDAYEGCYRLRNAVWGGSLSDASNVETLVLMHLDGSTYPMLQTIKNVVLMNSVEAAELRTNKNAFSKLNNIRIFVQHEEKQLRWDANFPGWNYNNYVYYADSWAWSNFYLQDGTPVYVEPRQSAQIIRLPVCTIAPTQHYTYQVVGWDLDSDGRTDSVPAVSATDLTATAIVREMDRYYTVQFADPTTGTIYHTEQLLYGEVVNEPEMPQKLGYVFQGWDGYSEGMTAKSDKVIYATWVHEGSGHIYGDPIWVQETCTDPGYFCYICSVCLESYTVSVNRPLGHAYVDTIVQPSCTESGYTVHSCTRCEYSYVDAYELATGHTFGEWILGQEGNCQEYGTRYCVCDICGYIEVEQIDKGLHSFVEQERTESTCTHLGKVVYCCRFCHASIEEDLPLCEHDYSKHYDVKAILEIPSDMFKYLITGNDGKQYVYACTNCQKVMTSQEAKNYFGTESENCGHINAYWETVVEASCSQSGIMAKKCDDCDEYIEAKILDKESDHRYHPVVTAPTCAQQGYTTYTCACGDSYIDDIVEPLGHNYVDGLCDRCGDIVVVVTQMGDLDFDGDVDADDLAILIAGLLPEDYAGYCELSDEQAQKADLNGDGEINSADRVLLARSLLAKYHPLYRPL